MPTYLLHGFRWPRPLVRIHIILQNLDDCAAEWLCSPNTTSCLLQNFTELFPESMPHLPDLRFIEQYDPRDESVASLSQPFAYVADVIEEVKLGVDVDEVRGRGVGNEQWGALMEIRDRLAPDEKVGWWVVVCGDEERWAPKEEDLVRGGLPVAPSPSRQQLHPPQPQNRRQQQQHQQQQQNNGNHDQRRAKGALVTSPPAPYENGEGLRRHDSGLRELREQVGYRTESDASDGSSLAATRYATSTGGPPTSRGNDGTETGIRTWTSNGAGTGTDTGTERTDTTPAPPSPKKNSVRRWLSKRKSKNSMRELAKAQARDQAPPLPSSSPALGQSPRLPVR